MLRRWLSAVVTAFLVVGCGESPMEEPVGVVEPVELGSVKRVHALGGVFLAGQPSAEDLRQAREDGIVTVVSLRKSDELDWDEGQVVSDLGMAYLHVPFRQPEELDDAVFDETRAILGDDSNRPLLLHCGSANRVGAVWYAHRVLDHGLTPEAARAEAELVGLKTEAYLERARAYVDERN